MPDRRRLGLLSRVAARTLLDYVQAAVGECEAVPGLIVSVQTFGSMAHLHPHLHVLMTDGGFRRDGTFVSRISSGARWTPAPGRGQERRRRRGELLRRCSRRRSRGVRAAGLARDPHRGVVRYSDEERVDLAHPFAPM